LIYKSKIFNITVIGGGPAGLAAAYEAQKNIEDVILIEREEKLGGILKQYFQMHFLQQQLKHKKKSEFFF